MIDKQQASVVPVPRSTFWKAAVLGGLAAFIALLPVSGVKTLMLLSRLCLPLTRDLFDAVVSPTTCGLMLNTWETTTAISWVYILSMTLGGALSGYGAARVAISKALRTPPPVSRKPRVYWWALGAGLAFDILLGFVFLYPGQ